MNVRLSPTILAMMAVLAPQATAGEGTPDPSFAQCSAGTEDLPPAEIVCMDILPECGLGSACATPFEDEEAGPTGNGVVDAVIDPVIDFLGQSKYCSGDWIQTDCQMRGTKTHCTIYYADRCLQG